VAVMGPPDLAGPPAAEQPATASTAAPTAVATRNCLDRVCETISAPIL
jgi:hypothetical protein